MYHFLESRQRNFLVSDQPFLHDRIKSPRIFFITYVSVHTQVTLKVIPHIYFLEKYNSYKEHNTAIW